MSRSVWRCKTSGCAGMLGGVDRYSKAFRPAQGVTAITHGVSVTLVCPLCGRPRVFKGFDVQFTPQRVYTGPNKS
jgi:hypothetical protein